MSATTSRIAGRKSWIKPGLVVGAFMAFMNLRPGIFQEFGEGVFMVGAALLMVYWLLGFKVRVGRRELCFVALIGVLLMYLIAQGLLAGSIRDPAVLTSLTFIAAGGVFVVFLRAVSWEAVMKALIYVVVALSLSYLVTLALVLFGSASLADLQLASWFLRDGGEVGYHIRVFFPVSTGAWLGNLVIAGSEFTRPIGFYREPGIYQIVLIVCFFGVDFVSLRRKWLYKTILLANLALTVSTAGYGAFIAAMAYYYLLADHRLVDRVAVSWWKKIAAVAAVIPVALWFLLSESRYALAWKLGLHSGQMRVNLVTEATEAMLANPLVGAGYMSPSVAGGNLLSVFAEIGILGVFIIVALVVLPNWKLVKDRHPVLVLVVPVVLTALIAQPLFDKSLFFLNLALVVTYPYLRPDDSDSASPPTSVSPPVDER